MSAAEQSLVNIKTRLKECINEHSPTLDAILFNGSTVVVLFLTAATSVVSGLGATVVASWVPATLSALAGILVAAERALGFGARWRYHREMRSSYEAISDMIDFYPALPEEEKPKYLKDIFTALYAVRGKESAIPNSGNTPST